MLPMESLSDKKRLLETPLPWKQLGILLLLNICEPISATVIYPFIAQLIEELGVAKDKESIGYYVGLVESLFFLTEAFFVLQWGRLSDRIGRKPVLLIGLLGLVLSMTSFGLSHSFFAIIVSRALAGALNGNIGVMKSAIGEITDESNMARAFSFLPLIWFIGSTVAPILGGYLSHPAETFPSVFGHAFWRENPYFLPCGTTALFTLICFTTAFIFLKETKPQSSRSAEGDIALFNVKEEDVEAALLGPSTDTKRPPKKESTSLRSLLLKPVLLAVINYGLLAILEISFQVLLPIFLATSLHYTPSSIGLVLGIMGLVNGIVQITCFVPLHRRFGSGNLFTLGLLSFVAIFATYPFILRAFVNNGGQLGVSGYALLGLQMVLCPIEQMSFNIIFLYVQASSPTKETLGAVNGIAQTMASIARAIGPASATSLFALSMQRKDIAGGYLVYCVLGALTVVAVGVSRLLPAEPRRRSVKEET
ncbi:hypothetical protein M408DRAFT_327795 [Serendipita vermifera MAFF 305830]|uniref:Major facilitator superfamily (MFS) profile domain-containing protein n=1 Tax=Serendipita vermifera MAFF 305830 TaxID=933852 RepID=A0A0C3BFB2_SERVB|nr:hypothetical protein M408DRAFT_327795 [Serendipita vermifera MAFF 305830]